MSYVVAVSGLLPAHSGERIHLADALHALASFCADIGVSQPLAVSCSCSWMLEMITVPNLQALGSVGSLASSEAQKIMTRKLQDIVFFSVINKVSSTFYVKVKYRISSL